MTALTDYIDTHTTHRPGEGVLVHDRWVQATSGSAWEDLVTFLDGDDAVDTEVVAAGTGVEQLTAWLGDRRRAIDLLGLGAVLGVWELITPATFAITGSQADGLAAKGFLFADGWWPGGVAPASPGGARSGRCPSCGADLEIPEGREALIFARCDRYPPERTVITAVPPGAQVARFGDDPLVHRCER